MPSIWGPAGWIEAEEILAALPPSYMATLGGVGLHMPPGGYERSLGQQYAAKLSTAGTTQADRVGDQLLVLNDWSGGEGALRHTSITADTYRAGSGIDVYGERGAVGLGPRAVLRQSTALDELTCTAILQAEMFVGASNGVIYTTNGTSWTTDYTSGKAGGITAMARFTTDLCYAANGTDGAVFQHSVSLGWVLKFTLSDSPEGCRAMASHWKNGVQVLYLGGDQLPAGRAAIHHSDGTTATAFVLLDEPSIGVMIVYKQNLMVVGNDPTSRRCSLYAISNSGLPNTGFGHLSRLEGSVLQCAAVVGDSLYLGDKYHGRIWKWDGSKLSLFYQVGATEAVPYAYEIRGLTSHKGGLWASIKNADGSISLLRFNAEAATEASRPIGDMVGTNPGLLTEYGSNLYVFADATGASKIYATDGTYAASGYVESGLINADLTGTGKLWTSVRINHSLLAATQAVSIYYKLEDTGSWVLIGHSDVDGSTGATMNFPAAVMAEQIAFKMILAGTAGSATPLRVYALAARYLPAPGALKEWSVRVLMRGTTSKTQVLGDGSNDIRTGEQISAALWALVNANVPATFVDIDGASYTVRIVDWSEHLAGNSLQEQASSIGWELEGQLRLRETNE